MTEAQRAKHFRINPVELGIFCLVSLIFLNSVYNLFYDRQGFQPAALEPMASNPTSEGRSPASVSSMFMNLEAKCEANPDRDTQASKVRLSGSFCGAIGQPETARLLKAQITNTANKFNATVFTDPGAGKFSTDYIPLNLGKNPIHVEFSYQGGKQFAQDLNINKQ